MDAADLKGLGLCPHDILAADCPEHRGWVEAHRSWSESVSHERNPGVLLRARDLYAVYCASSNGLNYQGMPCPEWAALTDAVRGHWYTVAGRVGQIGAMGIAMVAGAQNPPDRYVLGHLDDPAHALEVWRSYSGIEAP